MLHDTVLPNLFDDASPDAAEELATVLARGSDCRLEHIVSHGQASPPGFWYDQDESEWVTVLRGAARLRFEQPDRSVELRAGDWIEIAAHQRHRVDWTTPDEPTLWLALFFRPPLRGR